MGQCTIDSGLKPDVSQKKRNTLLDTNGTEGYFRVIVQWKIVSKNFLKASLLALSSGMMCFLLCL